MTIDELIQTLEVARDENFDGNGETEVMIASQPTYPLANHLRGVAVLTEEFCRECDEPLDLPHPDCGTKPGDRTDRDHSVVWLLEGSQHYDQPYAPRSAWDNEVCI